MNKALMKLLCALFLALPASLALAQAQTRAYAPENLRTLTVAEQTRVIGLEYSEQSRGRRIPDDQLRFYLDQVRLSGWTFSRIKQDIATSLGGGNGGWNPGPAPGRTVRCESQDQRERSCQTGFANRARLSRQLSSGACIEGQSWQQQPGVIRVRNGCRGEFTETNQGWGNGGGNAGYTVTCASEDARYRTCAWDDRRGRPVVVQNLSKARCQEGSNWGHQRNAIWVNHGCRARFGVAGGGGGDWGGGNPGYGVQCTSKPGDPRLNWCRWDGRQGRPRLQQEYSQRVCGAEGRGWGYDANRQEIWVRGGCNARFGAR
jgi:hypothetical protein